MSEPDPTAAGAVEGSKEANGRSAEVAALVAGLRAGVDSLRELPLEGVPPALGDSPWP